MVHNHLTHDSLLYSCANQESVDGALSCLDMFCVTSGVVVSAHKIDYWILDLDSCLERIPLAWSHIRPGDIVKYLGVPFGIRLSPLWYC
jgi:hypothetical protein